MTDSEAGSPARITGTATLERRGKVGVITIERQGRGNAWGKDISDSLNQHLADISTDQEISACVLTGAGSSFCSGADMGDSATHKTSSAGEFLRNFSVAGHPTFRVLQEFRRPVIGVVRGNAIGAGFILALHCDVVFAGESARFSMPNAKLGIIPASGASNRLAQWVGRGRALEICLSGRYVGAQEAHNIGIATGVYPDDEVLDAAITYADEIASYPPLAMWALKESIAFGPDSIALDMAGLVDRYRTGLLQMTDDTDEAHVAWREKRPPQYRMS